MCSADIHRVKNHSNKLYFFMVPMTPFGGHGSWTTDVGRDDEIMKTLIVAKSMIEFVIRFAVS